MSAGFAGSGRWWQYSAEIAVTALRTQVGSWTKSKPSMVMWCNKSNGTLPTLLFSGRPLLPRTADRMWSSLRFTIPRNKSEPPSHQSRRKWFAANASNPMFNGGNRATSSVATASSKTSSICGSYTSLCVQPSCKSRLIS
jgi:hypothetical protein